MSGPNTSSPYTSAARRLPIAAAVGSSAFATVAAASAVELAAMCSTVPRLERSHDRHCAVATGIEWTDLMSPSFAPRGASKLSATGSTSSRWIRRSTSKASVSIVALTVPSIAFSIGTTPSSAEPSFTAKSASTIESHSINSAALRSASRCSACSVKVPAGPRNATRRGLPVVGRSVSSVSIRPRYR